MKTIEQLTIPLGEENDPEEFTRYERERPDWVHAFNSLSGLTSMKTNAMQRLELKTRERDLEVTLKRPPLKIERVRTKGKFQVVVPPSGLRCSIERQWQEKANPHPFEIMKKKDEFDTKM